MSRTYRLATEFIAAKRWCPNTLDAGPPPAVEEILVSIREPIRRLEFSITFLDLTTPAYAGLPGLDTPGKTDISPVIELHCDQWGSFLSMELGFAIGLAQLDRAALGHSPTVQEVCAWLESCGFTKTGPDDPEEDA